MPFARALIDKVEDMKRTARGQPALPMEVPSLLETLSAPWPSTELDCECEFAGFGEVFNYLRGNRKLQIPDEFRGIIPKALWKIGGIFGWILNPIFWFDS